MSEAVRAIQQALAAAGNDPGPADGAWGRRSIAALRAFQSAHALAPDGIAGAATLAALGIAAAPPIPWLEEARRLDGTREMPGQPSNSTILDWAGALGIAYAGDDVAWCGLFVAHCIGATLPAEPLPAKPLAARGWLGFGRAAPPGLGAVMIFWRGARSGWLGHVGLYAGEDDAAYHVLGGNQSDRVCIARIARDRLLQARWPLTAAGLAARPLHLAATGAIATREA